MENRIINISTVAEVAKALRNFKEQLVFVGGAVVSLYTDDVAADEVKMKHLWWNEGFVIQH